MLYPEKATSGPYLDSVHGSSSYGVNRTSLSAFGYSKGNCAHCHEQHALIGGSEPNPTGGPDKYVLFYTNHISQTDNFCFKCHTDVSSYQTGGLVNRSYSYRAGGYSDTLNDILEAFSFTSPSTSHNLDDIITFITTKSWGYTDDSNPCAACHNPHMAKGDPANAGSSTKSSGTRDYSPVSLPSLHSKDNNAWGLWGDNIPIATERMSNYTAGYQAPYRSGGSTYEPDGSTTTNGSNLVDFVTFCTDCHDNSNSIWSTTLGGNLKTIDWNIEKHGKGVSDGLDGAGGIRSPYSTTDKVLACTDCHEPHGAPNVVLIRKEVNGGTLSGQITTLTTLLNKELGYLCNRCHTEDTPGSNNWAGVHHNDVFPIACGGSSPDLICHGIIAGDWACRTCSRCHYHGAVVTDGTYSRRTF
ncbi:MAG: hypothetical protein A2Y97_04630 [Nitrospirae bacterium RBG_13_39_12]|nr:MAG: hypothetical protein A2Y97_04630 [Nitrospirae bacterium RBG_13_39_12]